jgi:hypothetical protein
LAGKASHTTKVFVEMERECATCTETVQFNIGNRRYTGEYKDIYCSRIETLVKPIQERAKRLWPHVNVLNGLVELQEEEAVIVGTVFKDMPLRTNLLAQYAKEVR